MRPSADPLGLLPRLRRIRAILFRSRAERDLDDEIELHLSLEATELVRQGLDPQAAAVVARRRFGRIDMVKDAVRTIRGGEAVDELRRDLVFAARALRRRPGFAAVVVLTLVIGLASATTIFGVVYGVLWAPLPYGEPDRIVTVSQTERSRGREQGPASLPNFLDWRARSRSFSALAAIEPFGMRLTTPEGPERIPAWRVTEGFFDVLRARPLLGRTFSADEYQRGRARVVVLDYQTWSTRFNADSSLVGKVLIMNDEPRQVIGVMPPGVEFPPRPGVWVPKIPEPAELLERNAAFYTVVGRLAPGVTIDGARADMSRLAAVLGQEYPTVDRDLGVALTPLRTYLVGSVRARLLVLFGSVGLLLLLTGANLTTLLFARAVEREGELAIRAALGAGRWRIARQIVAEHLLLAGVAFALSLVAASVALRDIRGVAAGLLPRAGEMHIGLPAVLFAAVIALAMALAPLRPPHRRRRVQRTLVVAEVALAVILVVGAGLFVRSVRALLRVDPGFTPENVLAITLQTESLYPADSLRAQFARTVEARFAALPGVRFAAVTTALPFGGDIGPVQSSFEIRDRPLGSARARPTVRTAAISPGYFAALHIGLRTGRAFLPTDDATHPQVAIVSAAFARQYWPGANPVGQQITVSFDSGPVLREIVGVVADVHDAGLDRPPTPVLYLPYAQAPTGGVAFVLETGSSPRALLGRARRELATINGSMPVASVTTLDELLAQSTGPARTILAVLGAFAVVAVVLAGLGIFGVMSHVARARTKEVSIRLALGASSRRILGLVLGEAVGLAGVGTLIGVLAALGLGRSIGALLYGVSPLDPVALTAGVALLLAVASVAAYVPARRAAAVDAVRALRQ